MSEWATRMRCPVGHFIDRERDGRYHCRSCARYWPGRDGDYDREDVEEVSA